MSPKICTFILILLGVTVPALSNQCPDRERIPTSCQCSSESGEVADVILRCHGITLEELKQALHQMDTNHKIIVDLVDMKLGYLPSEIFSGFHVVQIYIAYSELNGLAPPGEIPLQGLDETLEMMFLTYCVTEDDRPFALSSLGHLRRLKQLFLIENGISEVNDNWLSPPPPALTLIHMHDNRIERLGDRAFESLVNLEDLELRGNRFGPIKRSMLPGPGNRLKLLDLNNNALTSVPDDLFTDMPELRSINLEGNGIAHLQEKALKPIWSQLQLLNVRDNPIECDSSLEWLFRFKTDNSLIVGTCAGPLGREGMDLEDFIQNQGK